MTSEKKRTILTVLNVIVVVVNAIINALGGSLDGGGTVVSALICAGAMLA